MAGSGQNPARFRPPSSYPPSQFPAILASPTSATFQPDPSHSNPTTFLAHCQPDFSIGDEGAFQQCFMNLLNTKEKLKISAKTAPTENVVNEILSILPCRKVI